MMVEIFLLMSSAIMASIGVYFFVKTKNAQKEQKAELERLKIETDQLLLKAKQEAQAEYERIIEKAREEARALLNNAQTEYTQILERARKEAEAYEKEKKEELRQKELQLERRLEALERREEELFKREKDIREKERSLEEFYKSIREKEKEIEERLKEVEELRSRELLELQRIASLTFEEARREVLKKAEEEARISAIKLAKAIEEEYVQKAEYEAKKIIASAVQRIAPEIAINYTTTTVDLPSNEFKGRIIGREGRNIRTFELLTGVDLIIDDTPDVVTISSFDPLRREIAKEALQRLIEDGRIHPARIEEVVEEVKKEMDEKIRKIGEETCTELGLYDINPGLYYYIGKLYFRTSYSQNVLLHSKEVAYLAGLMAEELGLDAKMARRAGLLHDIGKSISHELGGSHTDIGVELCKKYGEPDLVINAIRAHHNEEPVRYPEVALVCAADALSAARPGARRESLEAYLKRLEKLESIIKSFPGVQNAYAVQAGREVRVIVNPDEISDEEAYVLSKNIARKIEEELDFPGQIKVVVIREKRFVEHAK
ncbi:ribonuclease Y [Thermocrinis minervae]|uniref:Ribonuclease Y n=1 Tax=Thermocrinis minervae TaxID=381751 RepID=A0A1M6Q3A9_9AQUI|nr:ribonuclease Y [Thermocrinis minervae]SHK14739.1 ribonucrease Y [Thermocrinis minervae]